ncbi:MAG: AAA family ATPase, partial [Planctomycetaceae bacterium]|nr:AAA family ATPase [Planctomycetaceae bacterium]
MTQESFFGFLRRPFQASPQDESFVALAPTVEAIHQLKEAVEKGDGICVLTAAPGLGKTVVCRQLERQLEEDFLVVRLPSCNFPTRRSLLQAILHALHHEYRGLTEQETRLQVLAAAKSALEHQDGLVLIVDEADQLGARLLEELRCLTNHVERGRPLIRVVLSGQLALEEVLTRPELDALNHRISCHATLEPFGMQQSARYVDERLASVDASASSLFTTDALEMVCRISDGNPRCLNHLADACLTGAAALAQTVVAASVVRSALHELKQLPLHWNESVGDQPLDVDVDDALHNEVDDCADLEGELDLITLSKESGSVESEADASFYPAETAWTNDVATIEFGSPADRVPMTVPVATSAPAPSSGRPRRASIGSELQEFDVYDPYAALDRNSRAEAGLDPIDRQILSLPESLLRVRTRGE